MINKVLLLKGCVKCIYLIDSN